VWGGCEGVGVGEGEGVRVRVRVRVKSRPSLHTLTLTHPQKSRKSFDYLNLLFPGFVPFPDGNHYFFRSSERIYTDFSSDQI